MVFLLSKSLERVEWKRKQPTQSDLVSYAQPQNCLGRWRLLEIQEKTILPTEIFSIASTFQPFGSDDFPMFRVFFCHISSRDVSHVQAFVIFITICGNDPIGAFPSRLSFLPQGTSPTSTAPRSLDRWSKSWIVRVMPQISRAFNLEVWRKDTQKTMIWQKKCNSLKSMVIFGGYPMLKA